MSPHPSMLRYLGPTSLSVLLTATLLVEAVEPRTPLNDPSRFVPHNRTDRIVADLAAVPEVSLIAQGERTILYKTRSNSDDSDHPVLEEFDKRPDLAGMPVLRDDACKASPSEAARIGDHSRELRRTLGSAFAAQATKADRREALKTMRTFHHDTDVGLTLQMLQCESDPARKYLLERMHAIGSPTASRTLAQRALYETDPTLRRLAVEYLKTRPSPSAKQVLLDGLRHPFPAFADFAAEALTILHARELKNALVDLLDKPDPLALYHDADGKPVMREVVRVNHARNCQLCHAPSWATSDVARVGVPLQSQPLPDSFSVAYYEAAGDRAFVTVGVTYLRQDFSLTLPVSDPGPWSAKQRFDFFVRARPAEAWEVAAAKEPKHYPQRYAVLRTLRAVTGYDFGDRSADWRKGLR